MRFGFTVLNEIDLNDIIGIDETYHRFPSTLSVGTVFRSSNTKAEHFLRRAGLPENVIGFARSFIGQAIQFYSCFISFSTVDREFADRPYADLQNKGIRCWFAPHDIRGGKKIHEQIDEAIRIYDRLLLILSAHQGQLRPPLGTAVDQRRNEHDAFYKLHPSCSKYRNH